MAALKVDVLNFKARLEGIQKEAKQFTAKVEQANKAGRSYGDKAGIDSAFMASKTIEDATTKAINYLNKFIQQQQGR